MGIERMTEFWPDWTVGELIGEGSYGKVYKATRSDRFLTSESAVKVISIPRNNAEFEALRSEGMTVDESKSYLEGVVYDFVNEIKLMEELKNTPNIVSVEDYKIIEKKDTVGWDIFIRMELLRSFRDHSESHRLEEKDVIKLGLDIASALELCEKKKIIHRDIKPANIFISKDGDYKLGDFGVAKELSKTSGAMSSKGTYTYMAPEVAHGLKYDSTVDIYSLGLVMYMLLNNNRLPFTDPRSAQVTYNDRLKANERRLAGEALPPPCNESQRLADVILFACQYDPKNRFRSPSAFKTALRSCLSAQKAVSAPPTSKVNAVPKLKTEPAVRDIGATVEIKRPPQKVNNSASNNTGKSVVLIPDEPKKSKTKKKKRGCLRFVPIMLLLLAIFSVWASFNIDTVVDFAEDVIEYINDIPREQDYKKAQELMDSGDYEEAAKLFRNLDNYKSSSVLLSDCLAEIQSDAEEEQLQELYNGSYTAGDTVKFGFYEQDNDKTNGNEEIEWIVLETDGSSALLVSKYALEAKKYNSSLTSDVYWQNSSLYRWMNNSFLEDAFSSDHRDAIFNTGSGKLRLISKSEYMDYIRFLSEPCDATDYSGCYENENLGSCYWWLMDEGTGEYAVATVDPSGKLEVVGRKCNESSIGVRPVILINLNEQ